MRRALLEWLEAAPVWLGLKLLAALGPVAASSLGGAVARAVGPMLPVSRIAERNLRLALPELDTAARRRMLRGVWDNLGRTMGELANLPRLRRSAAGPGWETQDEARLFAAVAEGGPVVVVSGHLANWEMLVPMAAQLGVRVGGLFRAAGNRRVDRMVGNLRRRAAGEDAPFFPKGAEGARAAFTHLRRGGVLGVMVDQKLNNGIAATLFGHAAMTAPAAAAFALRLRCPVLPVHVERIGPARLRIVFDAPLTLPDSGDRAADTAALTQTINYHFEEWVRARPESWLWLHRRWPNEVYQ